MKKDIICIGHITKDKIVTPQTEVYMPGGTSFYFSYGLNNLKDKEISYQLITSLAEEDMKAVKDMRAVGIDVQVIPSQHTVFFENIYGENQDNRQQRVRAKADPFSTKDLQDAEAQYIVLGSLLADDFSVDVIRHLSSRGTTVVDAQGYLREVRGEEVFPTDWPEKREALKYIDILKVNEEEVITLTSDATADELKQAQDTNKTTHQNTAKETDAQATEPQFEVLCQRARLLLMWGVKEVLLTLGSHGSIVLTHNATYPIEPVAPRQIVDATGCGDTYLMGYIYQRAKGAAIPEAAHFAALVSARKLEASGPFNGKLI